MNASVNRCDLEICYFSIFRQIWANSSEIKPNSFSKLYFELYCRCLSLFHALAQFIVMNSIWNMSTKFWLDRCTMNDTTNWCTTERYTLSQASYKCHRWFSCCHCYSTNNNCTTFPLSLSFPLLHLRCTCSNLLSWNFNWKSTIRISKLQTIPINPVHQWMGMCSQYIYTCVCFRVRVCAVYVHVRCSPVHIILMTASCCLSLLSIPFWHLSIIPHHPFHTGWYKPHSQLKLIAVLAANETIEFQSRIDFRGKMCLTGFILR